MDTEQAVSQLATVKDFIRWGVSQFQRSDLFFGHGTDNAWDEATTLVLHALHLPYENSKEFADCRLTLDEKQQVADLLKARVEQRIPAAYLTHKAWFCGMPFYVDNRVLVPRSPFAELIQQQFAPWLQADEPLRILDLCTGSGCIGIASACAFEHAQVDLADFSQDALAVAQRNVDDFELNERVQLIHSDVFAAIEGKYDLIISNPPYVDAKDLSAMAKEFQHEPSMGLGSGDDGLDITRRILKDARAHLSDEGFLFVEVGNSHTALQAAFADVPFLWLDFAHGGHGVFMLTAQQLDEYQDLFNL